MKTLKTILYSIAVWISTCLIGSLLLRQSRAIDLDYIFMAATSLGASLPAAVLLIPNLVVVKSLATIAQRVVFSTASLGLICLVITLIFLKLSEHYPFDAGLQARILGPYVASAYFSFFIINRKLFTSSQVKS